METLKHLSVKIEVVPTEGIPGVLTKYVNWAPHGYVNAVQSQVALLYGIVELYVKNKKGIPIHLDADRRRLIADALSAYQEHKTKIMEEERKEHGESWRSSTVFYKKIGLHLMKLFLKINSRVKLV